MKFQYLIKLFIVLFVLGISLPSHSQQSNMQSFWNEFKISVLERDTAKLISLTHFSEDNGLIGKNKSEFYANYPSLFDEKTLEIMKSTSCPEKKNRGEYVFIGSGAYKIFKFKRIKRRYVLYHVGYYD